jgi:hypothetical protein
MLYVEKLPLLKSSIQSQIIRTFGYNHPDYDLAVTSEDSKSFIMDTLQTLTNGSKIMSSSIWKVLVNPDFDHTGKSKVLENILNNFH